MTFKSKWRVYARLSICIFIFLTQAQAEKSTTDWLETFDSGLLNATRWQRTTDGDFRQQHADVVNVIGEGTINFQLRLHADTLGTQADVVKFMGVRSIPRFPLQAGTCIALELDWNKLTNGSYLSAAVVLSPHTVQTNPLDTADWIKMEYIGIPPGKKARLVIGQKYQGRLKTLYTEGWPNSNFIGRKISRQKITIIFKNDHFEVLEDDRLKYTSESKEQQLDPAHLYLQLSSHSNYPGREVFFDNILFSNNFCNIPI